MKLTEKNRIVLKHALRDMKGYVPPDYIWNTIKNELKQDLLDQPLHEAISDSLDFIPPSTIWDGIELNLDQDQKDVVLKDAIAQLGTYIPSDQIWDNIEKEIAPKRTPIIQMSLVKKIMAVAAIGLLFWMVVPYFSDTDGMEEITYSEETIDMSDQNMSWEEDEEDFAMVAEWCKSGNIACQLPEFKALKAEMDGLDQAKQRLKKEISDYETDRQLIAKLTKIEIERGNVLKQMISLM